MEDLGSKMLQTILEALVSIGVAILVPMAVTYVRQLIQGAKLKMSAEQLALADMVVKQFVKAAEQYNLAQLLEQTGEEKKQWAIDKAEAYLKQHGISIDLDILADMVEAAVLSEINKDKFEFVPGALD